MSRATRRRSNPLHLVRQPPDPQQEALLCDLVLARAVAQVDRTIEALKTRRTVVHLRPVVPMVRAACEVLPWQACECGCRLTVVDGKCDVCLLKGE